MTKPAAMFGTYCQAKFMSSYKVMRISVDIPLADSGAFLKMFGTPDAVNPVPVFIARIDPNAKPAEPLPSGAPAPERSEPVADKSRTPFRELPRSQQAALKSRDQDFETWLIEKYWRGQTEPHDVDALLKDTLAVSSKRTLDLDHTAAARWDALLTDFDNRGYVR